MDRYFFHLEDGSSELDPEGVDLPDHNAAMTEAVKMLGQLLTERAQDVVRERGLKLIVTDAAGLILFILDLSAVAAPAVSQRREA